MKTFAEAAPGKRAARGGVSGSTPGFGSILPDWALGVVLVGIGITLLWMVHPAVGMVAAGAVSGAVLFNSTK